MFPFDFFLFPRTPLGHIQPAPQYANSINRKKKTERLVPPMHPGPGDLMDPASAGMGGLVSPYNNHSYANQPGPYGTDQQHLQQQHQAMQQQPHMNGGMTNHGYAQESK